MGEIFSKLVEPHGQKVDFLLIPSMDEAESLGKSYEEGTK